ncbi:type 1 glutamine amidotransferase domain-containing protein [uncultured Microbulbifer sp.]|uniref:type 1 glutamine amidotransferase domain-containing protein n=1 Tax=uncultured Microbulbifer sp. TaxID=348147 RepID=UPI0026314BF6|nr:type 1 glutamine amidotransferase domain-containing protein [uncultured Microbulbifer sp.]
MKIKQVIAAAALLFSPVAFADNILVVMSDASEMMLKGGTKYETGFYSNELMEPVKIFLDEGHTLTFASPKGMAPTLDVNSDILDHYKKDQEYYDAHNSLLEELKITDPNNSPVVSFSRIEQIGIENFDAIFVPGGHAPLADLVANEKLGKFLIHFNKKGKPTGLVCHGPAALLSALPNSKEFEASMKRGEEPKSVTGWIYENYDLTSFSNTEEATATKYYLKGDELFYTPEDALTYAGGDYKRSKADWGEKVVVDRELITGQNPASAVGVANKMLKMLK